MYSEYQTFAAKREKEEYRESQIRAREELHRILDDWMDDFNPEMTFVQFANVCSEYPFWSKLDLEEIECIFQDFVEDFCDKYMYKIKERHYQLKRDCFEFLRGVFALSQSIESIQWPIAKRAIDGNSLFSHSLDDLDKFEVFEDFFRDCLEKKREQKMMKKRRIVRKFRDSFIRLIEAHRDEIIRDMKWNEFFPKIKNTEEYKNLIGQKNSSQPYDLFAELRSNWKHQQSTNNTREPPLKQQTLVDYQGLY